MPLIMCEYIHAMGNSCGGADEYWNAIRSHHGLQGGFVWDWADQALVQTMADGTERLAYGGDFGDEPERRRVLHERSRRHRPRAAPVAVRAGAVMQPVQIEPIEGEPVRSA